MWRRLAAISRNVQNIRKSPRVADENMLGENFGREMERRRNRWNGFPIIYSILRAPLSLFSCFSHPHRNGIDGVWVSGELAHISEMNYLMTKHMHRIGTNLCCDHVCSPASTISCTSKTSTKCWETEFVVYRWVYGPL
ncbi:hypothetical protein RJ641_015154 [Dillenia turbinata]|uniref:Uncharacterized protein n=1 Tax=Dillenia turbinata TaxID=194707 RepID=A0AAN8UPF3_9MAGN